MQYETNVLVTHLLHDMHSSFSEVFKPKNQNFEVIQKTFLKKLSS